MKLTVEQHKTWSKVFHALNDSGHKDLARDLDILIAEIIGYTHAQAESVLGVRWTSRVNGDE